MQKEEETTARADDNYDSSDFDDGVDDGVPAAKPYKIIEKRRATRAFEEAGNKVRKRDSRAQPGATEGNIMRMTRT